MTGVGTDGTIASFGSPLLSYAYYNVSTSTSLGGTAPTSAGSYTVIATFAGNNNYQGVSSSPVAFTITKATPTVNAIDAGGTYDGLPFAATATVKGVSGSPATNLETVSPTFTYYSGSGTGGTDLGNTAPNVAGTYTVAAAFAGSADYLSASSSPVTFVIGKATPTISWATPRRSPKGRRWPAQLDASASWTVAGNLESVAGKFVYTPTTGITLPAGNNTLSVTFTPTDTIDYTSATASTTITVVGTASLSRSTVGTSASQVAWGDTVNVTLTAMDANGNRELAGGLQVAFGLKTGSAGGTFSAVTDNKNGTYTVTFTATAVGNDTITATIGGWAVTTTSPTISVVPGTEWTIAGVGDFTGDGKADVLLKNTSTGVVGTWITGSGNWLNLGTVPSGWTLAGIGDFNGDGKADLLWQNTTSGEMLAWITGGSGLYLGTVPSGWTLAGIGDFNGDEQSGPGVAKHDLGRDPRLDHRRKRGCISARSRRAGRWPASETSTATAKRTCSGRTRPRARCSPGSPAEAGCISARSRRAGRWPASETSTATAKRTCCGKTRPRARSWPGSPAEAACISEPFR